MSQPNNVNDRVDSYLDDIEKYSTNEPLYTKEEAKDELKTSYPRLFDESYFDAQWEKRIAPIGFKQPDNAQLPDRPFADMSFAERNKFIEDQKTDRILPTVEEALFLDPQSSETRRKLKRSDTIFEVETKIDEIVKRKQDDEPTKVGKQRAEIDVYEKAFGGEVPIIDGMAASEMLGLSEKEFLNLNPTERIKLAQEKFPRNLNPFEKYKMGVNPNNLQTISLKNVSGDDEQGKYENQKQYLELARVLDNDSSKLSDLEFGNFVQALTVNAQEEFRKSQQFSSEMVSTQNKVRFDRITKKLAEIYIDTKEVEGLTIPEMEENQIIMYALVDSLNEMIPQEDLRLSHDSVKIETIPQTPQMRDPSQRTPSVLRAVRDAGGGINFTNSPQSSAYDKSVDVARSTYGFAVDVFSESDVPRQLIIEQLQNRLDDAKRNQADETQIKEIEDKLKNVQDFKGYQSFYSEILTALNSDLEYEEAMEKIRLMGKKEKIDNVAIREMMNAMMVFDSYAHDSSGADESSLDAERIKLGDMLGQDFLSDAQYKNRKFEGLPKAMQAIIMQNITEFKDTDFANEKGLNSNTSISVDALRDLTIEDINFTTDIRFNLTNEDLKRFVNYRDGVIKSGPAQLMHFMIDAGTTPTFNPYNQTFTKERNWMGYALFTLAPIPLRVLGEGFVGAAMGGAEGYEKSLEKDPDDYAKALGMGAYTAGMVGLGLQGLHEGLSDIPSYSSRVAAKIAIGDPGLMGDLPYLAHLYGFEEKGEYLAEYIGLGLDFLVPAEKVVIKNPIQRVINTTASYNKSSFKPGALGSAEFRDATVQATVGVPGTLDRFTSYSTPVAAIVDTLAIGTGLGLQVELANQAYRTLKGEGEISPTVPPSFRDLSTEQQLKIDEMINDQEKAGRKYTFLEAISEEGAANIQIALKDGLDLENPSLYAEKKFPNDTDLQQSFVENITRKRQILQDLADIMGTSLEDLLSAVKANEIAEIPYLTARAQMTYEANTKIPKKVTDTDSYKNLESYVFGRDDLSPAEKNTWMASAYAFAEFSSPGNPKAYLDRMYFDNKPITQVPESTFDNVSTFYKNVADESVTANDLIMSLQLEPVSTRGVKSFSALTEVDGVPALFEKTETPIDKSSIRNHYTRSLERSSSFENKKLLGSVQTSKFLDSQYKRLQETNAKLVEKGVPKLLEEELSGSKEATKKLDKGKKRSLRINYEKNLNDLKIIEQLGSEQYLVSERIKLRNERLKKSTRFEMTDEQKETYGKISDMTVDADTLRDARYLKRQSSLQDKLLRDTGVIKREENIKKITERIEQLEQELEATEGFAERQRIIEDIQNKKSNINNVFFTEGLKEQNVKNYDLGGKNEKARVRFVDEEDGVFRVETMRVTKAQKELPNLNKELYYRSEFIKTILEDASSSNYKTVSIPLGDLGIFNETLGKRITTKDYYEVQINRKKIADAKVQRENLLASLDNIIEQEKVVTQNEITQLNKYLDTLIEENKTLNQNLKETAANKSLPEVEERFVEIITGYLNDIDENLKVEVNDQGMTIHLTEEFRNVIGRTIEEEPTVYYNKGVRFIKPSDELAELPKIAKNEEEIQAVKVAREKLIEKSNQLEEIIKNQKMTDNKIRVENNNIKIELQRLKDFEETGYFESDGSIKFFKRDNAKMVISVGEYTIIGKEFVQNQKKGFLFETLVDKKTGTQVNTTLNQITERATAYENFKEKSMSFVDEVSEFTPYLKYFESYTAEKRKLTSSKMTQEEYVDFRTKLGVTSEPKNTGESYLISHLLNGKPVRKNRKSSIDTTTIDVEFKTAFEDKANKLRDLFIEQGIDQESFTRTKTGLKKPKVIEKALEDHKKSILKRFEAENEKINTTVLRYMGQEFANVYKDMLGKEQGLTMDSLSVSETTGLLTEMLAKDYEIFGFDSASGHMLQNFSDIFDQVGGASSPDLIKANNKVYPALNLGMTKDTTKSFFGQDLAASINTDVRTAIDYLSRDQLSGNESFKLEIIKKIFGLDETLTVQEQKVALQRANDMYQTFQPKRTDQTYYGLRKKAMQRLIDGIDEIKGTLDKKQQADINLLDQKQKELAIQRNKYEKLQKDNEGIVFTFGGDQLHTDVMHFAADQTEGAGRMQGIMNDLYDSASFSYKNMVMEMESITKSYVENMVLDSAQLGFDSIGFEKSLKNTKSVQILTDIAERFGKTLEEVVVFDRSGVIPTRYEFISFKLPKKLKANVSNVTGTRFVRSIKTQDPVRLNGSHILQMVEDGEVTVRTPYGALVLEVIPESINMIDEEGFIQAVSDVNREINKVNYFEYFESTDFDTVDPSVKQDYQQSMYTKGVAYEFQEALKDYVQFEIKGLDEIENVSLDQLKRASKPISGEITLSPTDAENLGIDFDPDEPNTFKVFVEPKPGKPLTYLELVALEQGVGLNDTLKVLQEELIQAGNSVEEIKKRLGFALDLDKIGEIVQEKKLPQGFLESSFAKHPQSQFSPLLPLLFEEHRLRVENLDMGFIEAHHQPYLRDLSGKPKLERAIIEEGDVVSQIEIDGNRLRVKLSDSMTFNDFLVTNANIIEMIMPDKAYKYLSSHFDSVGGRLTTKGAQQFASEFTYYIKTDLAPDLRTRAMFDHSIGYLSRWFDLAHRQAMPDGLKTQMNTLFNPHGKAIQQSVVIGKNRAKNRVRITPNENTLEAIAAKPSKEVVARQRQLLSRPTQKALLEQLNKLPSVKKLQRSAVDENNNPVYRYGEIKIGDEIDPLFLLTNLYALAEVEDYKQNPSARLKGGGLANIIQSLAAENIVELTPNHFVPESVRNQVQTQVNNQLDIIFGKDHKQSMRENQRLNFDETTKRQFVSVVNSLGDVNRSFPQSLVDFVFNPESRNFITFDEYNKFQGALSEREVPFGFSNKAFDVETNKTFYQTIKKKLKDYLLEQNKFNESIRKLADIIKPLDNIFSRNDVLIDLPPSIKPFFAQYVGEIKKTSSEISRKLREVALAGEESRNIRKRLQELNTPEAEIEQVVDAYLFRNNTHKRITSVQLLIQENLIELERVDRQKLSLFYRMYDDIVEKGVEKNLNIFELFTHERLDQIENVFTSKRFGISDAEVHSIKQARNALTNYLKTKEGNVNTKHVMSAEDGASFHVAINQIQEGLINRHNYLHSIGDEVFRRFTGYDFNSSGIAKEVNILSRKLLTLLFEGRFLHEPGVNIIRRRVTTKDIFNTNQKGQISFKATGEVLTLKSAKEYLYANGYGFVVDAEKFQLGRIKDKLSSKLTLSELSEVVAEIISREEAQSIQTFLATEPIILNNFLAVEPKSGRHDMLSVLGGLAIMTHERLATGRLADRLASSSFLDLESRLADRRKQYGNYFVDDMEGFKKQVTNYIEQILSGQYKKNVPADIPEKGNGMLIVDGELPSANSSLLNLEAYQIAIEILKDLELPIMANRKLVSNFEINGQTYILPSDFVNGLQKIKDDVVGSLSLGRFGESEMMDAMVMYEAERRIKTDLVTPDIKKLILENSKKSKENLREVFKKSVGVGVGFTVPLSLLGLLFPIMTPGVLTVIAGLVASNEALKFDMVRSKISALVGEIMPGTDFLENKKTADGIHLRFIEKTYHLLDPADQAKLNSIVEKFQSDRKIGVEKSLAAGVTIGVGFGFGVGFLVNPYLGIAAALATIPALKNIKESTVLKALKDRNVNKKFINDVREMFNKAQTSLLDEIGEVQLTNNSKRKMKAYFQEAQDLRKYLESDEYRGNVTAETLNKSLGLLAQTLDIPKLSANIKMSVTSFSNFQYWSTSFFGMINQEFLDRGTKFSTVATGAAAFASFHLTGSPILGFAGAKVARVLAEGMDISFTNGKRGFAQYRGPTAMSRPKQIVKMIDYIQETSLSSRVGVELGFYGGLGALSAGVALQSSVIGGVVVGYGFKKLLDSAIKNKGPKKNNFMLMTRGGKVYTFDQVLDLMQTHDVLTTYVREETGQIVASELRLLYPDSSILGKTETGFKKVMRSALEISEMYDLYGRMGMFMDELEMGVSPKEAAAKVRNLYFDYSDLSDFEKKYLRNVVLFYSFMRKNAAFMTKKLLQNPERIMGWMRLTKDMQEMAFRDGDSDLYAGKFWTGRMFLPPALITKFRNVDQVGVPFRHRSVQILPMSNVYDQMSMMNALVHAPFISNDNEPFYRYLTTALSPVTQLSLIPMTGTLPFTQNSAKYQKMSPRLIQASQNAFGYRLIGPENSGAMIEFISQTVDERIEGRTLATAERAKFKHPNPLDGRLYSPATEADGFKYFFLTNVMMPAMQPTLLGALAFPFVPAGRPARTLEAFDRIDILENFEKMFGASVIDLGMQQLGYTTNRQLIAAAQAEMVQRGLDSQDTEAVTQYAKEMVRRGLAIHLEGLEAPQDTKIMMLQLADEYIRTDDTDYSGVLGQVFGMPFVQPVSDPAILQQEFSGIFKNLKEEE